MKVAVVGGTGCGGAGVVRALADAGLSALVVSRGVTGRPPAARTVDWARLDRHDTDALRTALAAFRPDAVVDQTVYTAADAEGLGAALPPTVRRVVVASSAIVYGPDRPEGPYGEAEPLAPDDPFAVAKAAADAAARALPGSTVLRLGLLYGPGQAPLTPWGRDPGLCERLLAGEALPVPAEDPPRLQPIHAADYAELVLRILQAPEPAPVALNVAGDETLSWGDFFSAWATAWGTPAPNLMPLSPAALAARAPAYLQRFLPSLLAPTRLATEAVRRWAPDWRPRSLAAGLREIVGGG